MTPDAVKFAIIVAIMVSASVSDLRKREASDLHWAAAGIVGIAFMVYEMTSLPLRMEHAMLVAGTAMVLFDILVDTDRGPIMSAVFYSMMAAMFAVPAALAWDDPSVMRCMTVPAAFLIFVGMYRAGIVKGGADVKCLIVLAMVFPVYPSFLGFPMVPSPALPAAASLVLSFPLAVLFCASVLSMSVGVYHATVNIIRKDIEIPYMFMGVRMDVRDAAQAFVWPLHTVIDGKAVRTRRAQDPSVLPELEAAGTDMIWVTPMIPFLVPITIATVLVALIGDPFFLLFSG